MLTEQQIAEMDSMTGYKPKSTLSDTQIAEMDKMVGYTPLAPSEKPKGFLRTAGEAIGGFAKDITEPAVKTLAVWPYQGVKGIASGLGSMSAGQGYKPDMSPVKVPFYGEIKPASGLKEALGETVKTGALATGDAPLAGAMFMGGESLRKGETPAQIATASMGGAILGRGGELLGEGIKAIASGKTGQAIGKQLKQGAGRVVNSLVKPLMKDFSYGKNPGLAVAKEGITSNSLDELAQKIAQARNVKGQAINKVLSSPKYENARLDVTDEINHLNKAMEKAAENNDQTVINRLQEVKDALTKNLKLTYDDTGKPVIQAVSIKDMTNLTPAEASKLKTTIGDMTKWTGKPSEDGTVNKALSTLYGKVKEKINKVAPELKLLNEDYANLTSAHIATIYRDKIVQRQNLIGIAPKIAGYGGILAGIASKNPEVIIASIAELGLDKFMGSPYAKTRLASAMYRMSLADRNMVFSKFPQIKDSVTKLLKNAPKLNEEGGFAGENPKVVAPTAKGWEIEKPYDVYFRKSSELQEKQKDITIGRSMGQTNRHIGEYSRKAIDSYKQEFGEMKDIEALKALQERASKLSPNRDK